MINNYFLIQKILRRLALLNTFISILNIQFNNWWQDFHICLCIQSVVLFCLVESHEENLVQADITPWKRKGYFNILYL